MKQETYKGLGVILLSMAGYFVIYNLLMFEFMEQSKTLKDAIVDAFTVSGITIIHVRLLLIVIISLAASVIWLIDFVVYKSFCHIAGAGHISTSKILLTTLTSLLPGPLVTYFILSFHIFPMNGMAIKAVNSVIHVLALVFLFYNDMEKSSRVKFILLVVLYTVVSMLFSIGFRV